MNELTARNPREEASRRLGGRRALVLEPSPPAIDAGPWFADDPLATAEATEAVSPLLGATSTWDDVVDQNPQLAAFARDHWLADLDRLGPAPDTLPATRDALRALAFYVLSPARQASNGKIALRWTKGGFGTPFFGHDRQIRVEGSLLVVQHDGAVDTVPITTLRDAGRFVGVEPGAPEGIEFHDPPPPVALDEILDVDTAAVAFLDAWFGFSTLVLERLRALAGTPDDSRVQLWPEHFDPALELGDATSNARASYGASPGDSSVPQPYLYVSPWSPQDGDFWNAPFGGAALTLDQLQTSTDQAADALAFFEAGRRLLG
jgi:hypothetical protein